jgi:hypothetical protein
VVYFAVLVAISRLAELADEVARRMRVEGRGGFAKISSASFIRADRESH